MHWSAEHHIEYRMDVAVGLGGHRFDIHSLYVFCSWQFCQILNGWCCRILRTQIENLLTVYTGQPDILLHIMYTLLSNWVVTNGIFIYCIYWLLGHCIQKCINESDRYINDLPHGLLNEYLLCACVNLHIYSKLVAAKFHTTTHPISDTISIIQCVVLLANPHSE
jgi:hypothetical protein